VLLLDDTGQPLGFRADFIPDADGRVAWLRMGGRLYRHAAAADMFRLSRIPMPSLSPPTLPHLR
jgi:hypothetical protein